MSHGVSLLMAGSCLRERAESLCWHGVIQPSAPRDGVMGAACSVSVGSTHGIQVLTGAVRDLVPSAVPLGLDPTVMVFGFRIQCLFIILFM